MSVEHPTTPSSITVNGRVRIEAFHFWLNGETILCSLVFSFHAAVNQSRVCLSCPEQEKGKKEYKINTKHPKTAYNRKCKLSTTVHLLAIEL